MNCLEIDALLEAQLSALDANLHGLATACTEVHLAPLDTTALEKAGKHLDEAGAALGKGWTDCAAALGRDARAILQSASEKAVMGLDSARQALEKYEVSHGQAHTDMTTAMHAFPDAMRLVEEARDNAFLALAEVIIVSTADYQHRFAELGASAAALRSVIEDELAPAMAADISRSAVDAGTYASAAIPELAAALHIAFAEELERYMDLNEQASNAFVSGVRGATDALSRFVQHSIVAMLERSLGDLQGRVISAVEMAVAQAILETEVNVEVTSALSSIIPELIVINRALPVLEQAIHTYKEVQRILTLGLL